MRKWLPAVPILAAAAVTAACWPQLPAEVRPDWTMVLPVGALARDAEPMARLGFALLIPAVAVIVWAGLMAGARVAGRRGGAFLNDRTGAASIARFEPTYAIVVTGVVGLLALMHLALLAGVVGWPAWTAQGIGVTLGLGMAAIGNLMPRVRPNWIVGIRTRRTLNDPALWTRTHRYFGGLLMLAGAVVAIVGILAPRYAFVATGVGLLVAAVLAHVTASARASSPAVSAF